MGLGMAHHGAGTPTRGLHPPEHGQAERGLDPSQDPQDFLLALLLELAVPSAAACLAGSDILHPAWR